MEIRLAKFAPPLVIRHSLSGILFVFFALSCAAQKTIKPYFEDLSVNRPRYPAAEDTSRKNMPTASIEPVYVKPTKQVNTKVDAVLDSIDRFNLVKRFVDGFTIQIYSGQKREDAMNTKQKIMEDTPELVANLQYVQPKFRVTVGHYLTKLEAQKDLSRLKRHFSTAILVPERILIK